MMTERVLSSFHHRIFVALEAGNAVNSVVKQVGRSALRQSRFHCLRSGGRACSSPPERMRDLAKKLRPYV